VCFDEVAYEKLGINRTDGRCLDIVENQGPLTAGELAELSGLTTAAVTSVLDRLEQAGYARRVRSEPGQRQVMVELTPLMPSASRRSGARWPRRRELSSDRPQKPAAPEPRPQPLGPLDRTAGSPPMEIEQGAHKQGDQEASERERDVAERPLADVVVRREVAVRGALDRSRLVAPHPRAQRAHGIRTSLVSMASVRSAT
jgi:hypothetical protein